MLRKLFLGASVMLVLPLTSAQAGVRIGLGITLPIYAPGYPPPPYYYYRPYYGPPYYPVYAAPAPVYVTPPPVYVQPPPAYAQPAPVYGQPAPATPCIHRRLLLMPSRLRLRPPAPCNRQLLFLCLSGFRRTNEMTTPTRSASEGASLTLRVRLVRQYLVPRLRLGTHRPAGSACRLSNLRLFKPPDDLYVGHPAGLVVNLDDCPYGNHPTTPVISRASQKNALTVARAVQAMKPVTFHDRTSLRQWACRAEFP